MLMYQASRFAAALFLQRDWLVVDEGFRVVTWIILIRLVSEKL